MARTQMIKSNFTSGVLDPRLKSRTDITHYNNGVEIGDNIIVMPHGGVRRRGGLRFVHEIPTAVAGNCMLAAFSFNSTDQQYLLVFADLRIYFYKDGVLLTNINGSGFDYLVSPYPIAIAMDLKWCQTADTMIIVHEDHAPRTLVRGATDTIWTLAAITFTYVPKIDYNDASSPAVTSEVQDVTFNGVWAVGNTFKLDLEGVITEAMTYDTVTATTVTRMQKAISNLYNTGSGEVTVVFQAGTTYRVTFQNGAARNYDMMTGYATSGAGTIATALVTNGVPRTEDAWSATRGYPRTATFYENRLVFGGTRSKLQTVFMSATNDFYNFNLGQGLDDDAIQKTLDTDQVNQIQSVFSGRHLQVYTEGAEFFVPDFPITPEKSSFRPQTSHGSIFIDPIQADGATIFLDRYGRGLYQFIYDDVETSYNATSLSRLAAHLLINPVDMSYQQPSADEDTNYVYVVNGDATISVLNTLRSEEIAAWSRWSTAGTFLSLAVLSERVYVLTKRTNGSAANAWYVEELDFDYYTDSSYQASGASSATWAVPTHLNGIDCRIRGDGAPMLNRTPVAGSVTLEFAVTSIEIGRNFNPQIKLMPPYMEAPGVQMQMGNSRYKRARFNVKSSKGLIVNGYPMPERYLDIDALDTSPAAVTGTFEIPLAGWSYLQGMNLTQEDPQPLTLLAIEYELEMH